MILLPMFIRDFKRTKNTGGGVAIILIKLKICLQDQ